jgi:hypothetical protein
VRLRRDAREAEGARLLSEYPAKRDRGFESLSLRHSSIGDWEEWDENPSAKAEWFGDRREAELAKRASTSLSLRHISYFPSPLVGEG